MKRAERDWKSWITENGSYKLVALFVTLILWVTILGRGDIVMTKEVGLEFRLPSNLAISGQIDRQVTVRVSGPRMALKKFAQNPGTIVVDLVGASSGRTRVGILPKNVEVPFGVKVLGVSPETINVSLAPVVNNDGQQGN